MADQKISAMPSASTPLTGAELVPLIQSGANVQSTLANFGAYARTAFSNYGSFEDTGAAQTAAANTVTNVRINTTSYAVGMTRNALNSTIAVTTAGIYSVIISVQLSNSSSNYDDCTLWPTINGANVANSASVVEIPAKKGNVDGLTILTVQYTLSLNVSDYVGFKWISEGGTASILTIPASLSAPIHPAAAGVILSIIQVA